MQGANSYPKGEDILFLKYFLLGKCFFIFQSMNTLQSLQWEKFGEKKLENQKEYYVTTPENEVVIAIYFAKVPTV